MYKRIRSVGYINSGWLIYYYYYFLHVSEYPFVLQFDGCVLQNKHQLLLSPIVWKNLSTKFDNSSLQNVIGTVKPFSLMLQCVMKSLIPA